MSHGRRQGWAHRIRALLVTAFLVLPSAAQSMRFEIVRKVTLKSPAKAVTRPGVSAAPELQVEFAPDHVLVQDSGGTTWHDFAGKRVLLVKKGSKSVVESVPVLALVHFRDLELVNRRGLGNILDLAGADLKVDPFETVDTECSLGVTSAKAPVRRLESLEKDGFVVWSVDGTETARCLFAADEVAKPLRGALGRFLAHQAALHPLVRRDLVARARWPATLIFKHDAVMGQKESTWTWRLKADATPDEPAAQPTVQPVAPDLEARIALRLGKKPSGKPPSRADLIAQSAKADKAGKSLDAVLCLMEVALQFDAELSDADLPGLLARRAKDPQVVLYLQATGSEKAPLRGVELFGKIQRAGLGHVQVLDAQRGAMLNMARRHDEARKALRAALDRNPHLTLAWHDLGRTFAVEYDTVTAWQCYDIAREIAPHHPAVREMETGLAARLESEHPDFF